MTWLMLAAGFFLLLSGILGQAYSLKTKRGVLPPKTRIWRVLTRLLLVSCRPVVDGHGGRPDCSPSQLNYSAFRTVENSSRLTVVKITS